MAYIPGFTPRDYPLPGAGVHVLLLQPPATGRRILELCTIHNGHAGAFNTILYVSEGDAGAKRIVLNQNVGAGLCFGWRGPLVLEGGTDTAVRTNLWALAFATDPTTWRFSLDYGDELDEE